MVRNESRRFWRSALACWSLFADDILVLDDGSTDATAQIAESAGAIVIRRSGPEAWGNESPVRQQLFDLAIANTGPGDWILFLDADMCPARNPKDLAFNGTSDAWLFPLYDLWSADPMRYRWDEYWYGHIHPRLWMIKRPEPQDWAWPPLGIHSGHLPVNFHVMQPGFAPQDYGLLHFPYSTPELREQKFRQYMSVRHQLSPQQLAHAKTIIDGQPKTYPLPFRPEYRLYLEPELKEAA